ncbi:MAG: SDR family NAD(P)-dependent oxidoreductase, partial [Actinomycetota bacterium]|nr:SDR family NAD(P)-dependent oxidoreductase [Actinomycetota bacterium]
FCHRLTTDPAHRAAARADLPSALDQFDLTPHERRAISGGDVGFLLAYGAHPLLLVRLHVYGIGGLTEASYSERVRRAAPVAEGVQAMTEDSAGDRLCLITGATGGLGGVLATAFCEAGFHAVVSARDAAVLDALRGRIQRIGRATAIPADLREPHDVEELGRRVAALPGRLDVVVTNAGQAVDNSFLAPREPLAQWRDMVLVNVFGAAAVARVTLPLLAATQGSLFFVGSVTGRTVVPGDLYSVTKHAVSALAEGVRVEAEPCGVQVCVVQPGLMDTPLVSADRRSRPMIDPRYVANEILRLARSGRAVHVNEVVVRPRPATPADHAQPPGNAIGTS